MRRSVLANLAGSETSVPGAALVVYLLANVLATPVLAQSATSLTPAASHPATRDTRAQASAADAKRKADEARRLLQEAEAERNAVDAARKAEAERAAGHSSRASAPGMPKPAADLACETEFAKTFKSTKIRFPRNGRALEPTIRGFLERVANLAHRCPNYALEIAGHADRSGSGAANLEASLARAVAVRDALMARGIAVTRLNTRGYSDSRPLDPSPSAAAFKRNRRVELSAVLGVSVADPPVRHSADAPPRKPVALRMSACHAALSRTLGSIRFRFRPNSERVASSAESALDRIAGLVIHCPNHALVINGHSDRRGTADANQKLSDARADAIRSELVARGVPPGQLLGIGHGALMPVAHGSAASDFERNRRVDIDVTVTAPPRD